MTGKCIEITSGKGGVGKSTLAANLGWALARQGRSVVLVDLDIGLRSLDLLLGVEGQVVYDIVDVAEGVCKLSQALVSVGREDKLKILSAAQTRDSFALKPEDVADAARKLREHFDFVVLDCPAGIGRGFKNAAEGADMGLIVTNPEEIALRDAERVKGLLERAGVADRRLVVNRLPIKRIRAGEHERIAARLELPLLGVVPEEAPAPGGDAVARGTPAGLAVGRIARRLTGEDAPLPDIRPMAPAKKFIQALVRWLDG